MKWKRPRRSELLRGLLLAVAFGVFIGLIEVWELEMSWNRLLAASAAGIGFMVGLGGSASLVRPVFPRGNRIVRYACFAISGATGGAAWWLVIRPPSEPLATCLFLGAGMAVFGGLADEAWTNDASQSA